MGSSDSGKIRIDQSLLLSSTAFITRSTRGLNLNFESKKLLNILQVAGAMSGNANLQTISDLSKNYDGVRLGFEMYK